ncbi:amino acid ABC transporter permease [Treponema sp.]|uniref:amino acid ABC transporter permease n=1 Tax=Treponema sp. TaxID=166 RepID=UPI0038903C27
MLSSEAANPNTIQAITAAFSVLTRGTNFTRLLGGLWVTVWIALVSVAFSIVLGILLGMLMTVKNRAVKIICKIYLEIMRIMPQMVLLFMAYYGLTRAFDISLSGEAASILVFTLWGTAEMGDLVRGSLESVPKHQYESGRAIGLTERQVFFYIIIPQTLRSLIPLSMNLITRMIKTTSLVVFVGVIEVVKIGQQIIEANRLTVPTASIAVYFVIFMMYFFVCWILNLGAKKLEKKNGTFGN